jgi:alpha-beta hydrolase superfamily lysophospholipase
MTSALFSSKPASRLPRLAVRLIAIAAATALASGCVHHRGQGRAKHVRAAMAPSKLTTIGVNAYLWRASLETLSFMPLVQTDSNGGVIVTDWYTNPKNPTERVKVTVSILDQDLRADALRVAASRQVSQSGQWVDAPVQAATVQKLEDIILTKARDLRRSAVAG